MGKKALLLMILLLLPPLGGAIGATAGPLAQTPGEPKGRTDQGRI